MEKIKITDKAYSCNRMTHESLGQLQTWRLNPDREIESDVASRERVKNLGNKLNVECLCRWLIQITSFS